MHLRRGFTIIEILLAFAIASLFMGLIAATLTATLRAARKIELVSDVRSEGRALLKLMALDVSGAMYAEGDMESLLGEDSLREGTPADQLHLVSASQPLLSEGIPCEVSYIPQARSGKMALTRREAHPVDGRPTVGGSEIQVSSSLVALNIRYFDGNVWRDSWSAQSEGYLPVAVRVEMLLLPDEGEQPESFYEVVPVLAGGRREPD